MKHELVLVDDEPEILDALQRELSLAFKPAPFQIKTFTEPNDALSYVQEHGDSVFLVISDLRMPGMAGNDLLRHIRENNDEVRTILLTAYADLGNIQKAVATTLQSFMMKPWTHESLVAEVRRAEHTWELEKKNKQLESRIRQLLGEAGEFQQKLFTLDLPPESEAKISLSYEPVETFGCGGDFYSVFPMGEKQLMLVIGDVAGHGPQSAMVTAMVQTILAGIRQNNAEHFYYPQLVMERVNDQICTLLQCDPSAFVAMQVAHFDFIQNKLTLCSGGMPPAINVRGGIPFRLANQNPLLGAMVGLQFNQTEIKLEKGDKFLFMTDGALESTLMESQADDQYNTMFHKLMGLCVMPDEWNAAALAQGLRSYTIEQKFDDDCTLLTIEIP